MKDTSTRTISFSSVCAEHMTIIAQVALETKQPGFDQFLADFTDSEITVRKKTNPSPTDRQVIEVQASKKESLSRFHEMCVEHGITLDIRRIHHEGI